MRILVAYASAHGSTAEIAQFIGQVFEERDLHATVLDVETVDSVDGYDAFVLGSAIHGGMWLTSMSRFLDQFQGELIRKPVYFFITCIRVLEPDGHQHALEHYVHQETLKHIGVRDTAVFAGKLQMNAIDLNERWALALRYDGAVAPGGFNDDFRDWNAIREWATKVRSQISKV